MDTTTSSMGGCKTLFMLGNFHAFVVKSVDVPKNQLIKKFFKDHYQSGTQFVDPDLGPNCL